MRVAYFFTGLVSLNSPSRSVVLPLKTLKNAESEMVKFEKKSSVSFRVFSGLIQSLAPLQIFTLSRFWLVIVQLQNLRVGL